MAQVVKTKILDARALQRPPPRLLDVRTAIFGLGRRRDL